MASEQPAPRLCGTLYAIQAAQTRLLNHLMPPEPEREPPAAPPEHPQVKRNPTRDWTKQELAYLRDNYRELPLDTIAHQLGKPVEEVYNARESLRLGYPKDPPPAPKPPPKSGKLEHAWTPEKDEMLTLLCKAHRYSWDEVAQKLGRTVNSVRARVYLLQIEPKPLGERELHLHPSRRWHPDDDAKLRALCASGEYTIYDIAQEMQRSIDGVKSRITKLGCAHPRPLHCYADCRESNRRIMELFHKGFSRAEIADILGKTYESVASTIDRHRDDL